MLPLSSTARSAAQLKLAGTAARGTKLVDKHVDCLVLEQRVAGSRHACRWVDVDRLLLLGGSALGEQCHSVCNMAHNACGREHPSFGCCDGDFIQGTGAVHAGWVSRYYRAERDLAHTHLTLNAELRRDEVDFLFHVLCGERCDDGPSECL